MLAVARRSMYRTIKRLERQLLDRFPSAPRGWLHRALLGGCKRAFQEPDPKAYESTGESLAHRCTWASAGFSDSWNMSVWTDHDADFKPKFEQPLEIHIARALEYVHVTDGLSCPEFQFYDISPVECAEWASTMLGLLHLATKNGWDGRSFGLIILLPEVAKAVGVDGWLCYLSVGNTGSWFLFEKRALIVLGVQTRTRWEAHLVPSAKELFLGSLPPDPILVLFDPELSIVSDKA